MKKLNETGQRIPFIVSEEKVLRGVVTDGDLRKHILRGGGLEDPVKNAVNYHPKSLPLSRRGEAKALMQKYTIDAVPLVDQKGPPDRCGVCPGREPGQPPSGRAAGGHHGGRAGHPAVPLYQDPAQAPDPRGEMPILEHIIHRFRGFGCTDFRLVVNYKKRHDQILFQRVGKGLHRAVCGGRSSRWVPAAGCPAEGPDRLHLLPPSPTATFSLTPTSATFTTTTRPRGNVITMVCAFKHFYRALRRDRAGRRRRDSGHAMGKAGDELPYQHRRGYGVEPEVIRDLEDGKKQGLHRHHRQIPGRGPPGGGVPHQRAAGWTWARSKS